MAFYTLSLPLVFDRSLPDGGPAAAYRLMLGDTQPSRCRADRLDDTPYASAEQPEKTGGILVAGAALAPEIKPFYFVELGSECVRVVAN